MRLSLNEDLSIFLNVSMFKVDFQLPHLHNLHGKFWKLKSTLFNPAEFEKHWWRKPAPTLQAERCYSIIDPVKPALSKADKKISLEKISVLSNEKLWDEYICSLQVPLGKRTSFISKHCFYCANIGSH